MEFSLTIVGFTVGLLVGLTGMGGGLLMTPLLIFFYGVSPTVAVGTDLIYAGITKLFGFWQHWRQKTVDLTAIKWLAVTSVPGAVAGVLIVKSMLHVSPQQAELFLGKLLGVMFVVISGIMVVRMLRKYMRVSAPQERKRSTGTVSKNDGLNRRRLMGIGVTGGTLVGMTSVGSGTIFIALLSTMGAYAPAVLVGTDIGHAAILTLVAGSAHALIGTVNFSIIGHLLLGSIPGILLGSRLAVSIPEKLVQSGLILLLFLSGVKLL